MGDLLNLKSMTTLYYMMMYLFIPGKKQLLNGPIILLRKGRS